MERPSLVELGALPEVRVGHFGSLLVMVWRGQVTAKSVDFTNALERALIQQQGKVTVIGIITELSGGVPDAEMRDKAKAAMKEFQANVRGTALIIAATGVKAVLFRTFLAGLTLIIDFDSPMKVFRGVGEAVPWVQALKEQDPALQQAELAGAVLDFVHGPASVSAAAR